MIPQSEPSGDSLYTQTVAVLIVDVQRDFCPGGALAVEKGDRIVSVLNRLMCAANLHGILTYATRDWHPANSNHFLRNGGIWPVHCVAGSLGAQFHPDLHLPDSTVIVSKGLEPHSDGYSAFDGSLEDGTPIARDLQHRGITHIIAGGLATDYCVRHSVLDAINKGWTVTLVTDAVAAVEKKPGDGDRALAEMRAAGATLKQSGEVYSAI